VADQVNRYRFKGSGEPRTRLLPEGGVRFVEGEAVALNGILV
jgi:hypothetical protein